MGGKTKGIQCYLMKEGMQYFKNRLITNLEEIGWNPKSYKVVETFIGIDKNNLMEVQLERTSKHTGNGKALW